MVALVVRTIGVVRESFAGDKSALGIQCDRGGEPLVGARLEAKPGNPFCPGDRDQAVENCRCNSAAQMVRMGACLLYTSDAADDLLCVDLGGRRIIKKKK